MLLLAEGQHNANPTVGGIIFDYARSPGKSIEELLSDAEVRSAWLRDMSVLKVGEAASARSARAQTIHRARVGL
jgi:hypothetical protein